MFKRLSPVALLFLASPFIAEFVLGNLPARMLFVMLPLGLMYGTGAIFVRELVRQTGRGWSTLLLLAAAYGLVEEGLITQSLFNPNYFHLRLLDYGFIPNLGIGLPWLIYVITIHVAWSICVPIGLVECLFPERLTTPWLKKRGLVISGIAFVVGSVLIAKVSQKNDPYLASIPQLASVVIAVVLLVVTAFRIPKPPLTSSNAKLSSVLLFVVPFVCGSLLMVLQLFVDKTWHWPWQAAVLSTLIVESVFVFFIHRVTHDKSWTARNHWALMAGGMAVYLWFGFVLDFSMHGPTGLIGHACIAVVTLVLVAIAFFKTRQTTTSATIVAPSTI